MKIFLSYLVCLAFVTGPAFASLSAKQRLLQSSASYDKGQYQKALSILAPIDIRADFDNSDDMKLAFKIRAVAYEQMGDLVRAADTIRELFFLDPHYEFNPFDTSQSLVALARKEKAAIEEKSQRLASIKNESREQNKVTALLAPKPPATIVTLFPFGINHFYLHKPLKGSIYLAAQSIGLATNVGAFWWKQAYLANFGSTQLKEQAFRGGFNTAQTIQYIGLGALLISYSISVIDALLQIHNKG